MYIHEHGWISTFTYIGFNPLLHYYIMVSGKAKIFFFLFFKRKAVINDTISSKVQTLHPKPNTWPDIYRENPFPNNPGL